MYEQTPNLEHTIVKKGSMKALQRFIQIEMKEHDHGDRFFNKRCKWHECMQGTKYAVDLILENFN